MTEGATGPGVLVWERMRRRRLVRLALGSLLALCTLAVFAPFLASDRPYWLLAVHRADFDRARKGLVAPGLALRALGAQAEQDYLAARPAGSAQGYARALESERTALETRVETIERHLGGAGARSLDELRAAAERTLELARAGRHGEAARSGEELVELARALSAALDPAELELRPVLSFPLFAALTPLEVGLQLASLWLLAWPWWRRRLRHGARLASGASLGAALAWAALVGAGSPFDTGPFKAGLSSGEIEAVSALFPPVPFGFAEQHPEESLRPPTWSAAAELDAQGNYLRGARVPRADPITGFVPASRAVEVRAGEPALNSPWRHPLGTDTSGRDLLARLIHGARASLAVGLLSTVLLFGIGVLVGALAGSCGGVLDLVLSRAIEVVVSFPVLFLVLVAVAFVGPSVWNVIGVIGLLGWTGVARLARVEFQRQRELEYVLAARALGFSWSRVALLHVLPNALGPLLVAATFAVAQAILTESALSFLGFGVRVPIPSWGALASETRDVAHWWLHVFPGLALFVTILGVHWIGAALRDALDARGGRA